MFFLSRENSENTDSLIRDSLNLILTLLNLKDTFCLDSLSDGNHEKEEEENEIEIYEEQIVAGGG